MSTEFDWTLVKDGRHIGRRKSQLNTPAPAGAPTTAAQTPAPTPTTDAQTPVALHTSVECTPTIISHPIGLLETTAPTDNADNKNAADKNANGKNAYVSKVEPVSITMQEVFKSWHACCSRREVLKLNQSVAPMDVPTTSTTTAQTPEPTPAPTNSPCVGMSLDKEIEIIKIRQEMLKMRQEKMEAQVDYIFKIIFRTDLNAVSDWMAKARTSVLKCEGPEYFKAPPPPTTRKMSTTSTSLRFQVSLIFHFDATSKSRR